MIGSSLRKCWVTGLGEGAGHRRSYSEAAVGCRVGRGEGVLQRQGRGVLDTYSFRSAAPLSICRSRRSWPYSHTGPPRRFSKGNRLDVAARAAG